MKKKKIFIYIHQCILKGGVEKVFYNLLNNLPKGKYDVTILSIMGYLHGDINDNLYPAFVKRHWLYYDEWSNKWIVKLCQRFHNRFFPLLYKLYLKCCHFDVAIAAQEGVYAKFIDEKVKADKKILWIHNDISICHWTEKIFGSTENESACYKKFDSIVCVSESVKDSMNKVFGNLHNLCVCYNPIDTNEIDIKLKEFLPERDKEILFVCVGRLANQKGYDRLLDVCERLNIQGYKYSVWIIGEGEDRFLLEKIIAEKQLGNVKLLGLKSNPYIYMKQADWLLLPSRHEGFGMVLHEALYCGTPIITTLVAGAKELLGESEYGIIVENSKEGIYKGMKSVLDDPKLHPKYVDMAAKRRSFVDIRKRVNDIESLF